MHSSGSFLRTVLEKVRFYLDEVSFDAKYDDDYLIRYFIIPATTNVMARLNLNNDDPILCRHTISLVEGTEYYQLPPNVQEIWRFSIREDDTGRIIADAYPRNEFNPYGPGWSIEANVLRIGRPDAQTAVPSGCTANILYVPTGDVGYEYSSTGGTYVAATRTFTLAATPTYGLRERRPNALAGSILRILGSGNQWEERIIESHNATNNTVVVRLGFSTAAEAPTVIPYEIAPQWGQALYGAIALLAAMEIGVGRGISGTKMGGLQLQYRTYMKTIKDNLSNKQLRTGKSFQKNTVDNPDQGWTGFVLDYSGS